MVHPRLRLCVLQQRRGYKPPSLPHSGQPKPSGAPEGRPQWDVRLPSCRGSGPLSVCLEGTDFECGESAGRFGQPRPCGGYGDTCRKAADPLGYECLAVCRCLGRPPLPPYGKELPSHACIARYCLVSDFSLHAPNRGASDTILCQ